MDEGFLLCIRVFVIGKVVFVFFFVVWRGGGGGRYISEFPETHFSTPIKI